MSLTMDELLAHEEIRQAIYRHFRAGDRLDVELDRTAFWDDGQFDFSTITVREEIPPLFDNMRTMFTATMHYISNILISLQGEQAFVEAYATAYHIVPPESLETVLGETKCQEIDTSKSHELRLGIRYLIRMDRRDKIWKIFTARLLVEWSSCTPYSGFSSGGLMDVLQLRGTRDHSDPSYAWLAGKAG
jgi:hypothetical protein